MKAWAGRRAAELTAATLHAYGDRCHLCWRPGADTADHLVPRSQGGSDNLANLRPAHHGCNAARGARPLSQWYASHPVTRGERQPSRQWFRDR